MAKRQSSSEPKPRSDAYTGLLVVSLLALIAGCVFLYLDYDQYPGGKPPTVQERKPAAPEPKPAAPKSADDGDRARALLEGKAASAAAAKQTATADESGRFVVQVGAFADADKAKEVRQKLEKAGLETYMHVAKTADGERTRVRVGPFASRAEADRAASKVKGLSLPAAVLSL